MSDGNHRPERGEKTARLPYDSLAAEQATLEDEQTLAELDQVARDGDGLVATTTAYGAAPTDIVRWRVWAHAGGRAARLAGVGVEPSVFAAAFASECLGLRVVRPPLSGAGSGSRRWSPGPRSWPSAAAPSASRPGTASSHH